MKNHCFVFSLLLIFALASCSNDDDPKERVVNESKPVVTRSAGNDSLYVKGYNTYYTTDEYRGAFPENVVKDLGLEGTYVYTINQVSVVFAIESNYLCSFLENTGEQGYNDLELSTRSVIMSTPSVRDGLSYYRLYSYFIHIIDSSDGEQDRWIPCPPEEFSLKFYLWDKNQIEKQ